MASGGAESTPVPQATSTSAGATATGTSALANSPSTPTFVGSSSSSKKVNAGAIAGGVVGGVVFLAIVGGLIALILLRRRKNLQTARIPSTYTPSGKADSAMAYGDMTYNNVVPTSMTPTKVYVSPVGHHRFSTTILTIWYRIQTIPALSLLMTPLVITCIHLRLILVMSNGPLSLRHSLVMLPSHPYPLAPITLVSQSYEDR